jgi:hypothetical protein
VLVVAADYRTERVVARVLREFGEETGHEQPLPVLVTTGQAIAEDPDGLLGPIWREPSSVARRVWPRPSPHRRRAGAWALVLEQHGGGTV